MSSFKMGTKIIQHKNRAIHPTIIVNILVVDDIFILNWMWMRTTLHPCRSGLPSWMTLTSSNNLGLSYNKWRRNECLCCGSFCSWNKERMIEMQSKCISFLLPEWYDRRHKRNKRERSGIIQWSCSYSTLSPKNFSLWWIYSSKRPLWKSFHGNSKVGMKFSTPWQLWECQPSTK